MDFLSIAIAFSLFSGTADEYSLINLDQNCSIYESELSVTKTNDTTSILIALGELSSGGYGFEPKTNAASFDGETIWLDIDYYQPAPGMMTTMALTSPCIEVTIPDDWSKAKQVQLNGYSGQVN